MSISRDGCRMQITLRSKIKLQLHNLGESHDDVASRFYHKSCLSGALTPDGEPCLSLSESVLDIVGQDDFGGFRVIPIVGHASSH